jgi:hypothetical protein
MRVLRKKIGDGHAIHFLRTHRGLGSSLGEIA